MSKSDDILIKAMIISRFSHLCLSPNPQNKVTNATYAGAIYNSIMDYYKQPGCVCPERVDKIHAMSSEELGPVYLELVGEDNT